MRKHYTYDSQVPFHIIIDVKVTFTLVFIYITPYILIDLLIYTLFRYIILQLSS